MKKYFTLIMAMLLTVSAATAQIDRSKKPVSGAEPIVKLVEPKRFTLKNGLKVLVVTDKKFPTVSYGLTLDNAPVVEGSKAGVQSLTSALVGKGTQKTDKNTFNEEIDFLGASVGISPTGGYGYGLSRYKDRIMELMAEAAFMPKFTQEELDFEKEQLIQGIKSGENSAEAIASRVRSALVYGKNHPAGEFATEESIANVTLSDVETFFKEQFKPENAYMVISGDISEKDAKKLVNKYFGKWEKGTVPTYKYPEVKDVAKTEINFVNVPNAVQTELAIYNVSDLRMSDADYFPALVTNYVYGGSFGSYLNMNLREAKGYTYGARSSLGAGNNYKSTFSASAKVRNQVTDSAVVETLKELKRLRTTPVDDRMLSNAKAQFLGNFIMSSEDKSVVADRTITIETRDLPKDFYATYIENINKVTKEDVQRIANKYMKLDNLRIILVGKASDVLEPLEKMEFEGQKFDIKYFDKYANPTKKPSTAVLPAGTTAITVLDAYEKAIGSAAAKKMNSYFMVGELSTPQGALIVEEKRAKGNKFLQVVKLGTQAVQQQSSNGTTAKANGIDLSGPELQAVQDEAMFFPEMYRRDMAKLEGADTFNGKNAAIITYGNAQKHYYDLATGLKLGYSSVLTGNGQELPVTITHSDYKAVDGVMFPMKITQAVAGQEFTINVKSVEINKNVKDADFN